MFCCIFLKSVGQILKSGSLSHSVFLWYRVSAVKCSHTLDVTIRRDPPLALQVSVSSVSTKQYIFSSVRANNFNLNWSSMAPHIIPLNEYEDYDYEEYEYEDYVKHVVGSSKRGKRAPCGSWKKYLERFTGNFPHLCQMEGCENRATLGKVSKKELLIFGKNIKKIQESFFTPGLRSSCLCIERNGWGIGKSIYYWFLWAMQPKQKIKGRMAQVTLETLISKQIEPTSKSS